MKFIHISDLHIGKRLNEYSLIEDQKYILNEIIEIIKSEQPDAVFIAGDVYDKSVPSAEAVSLLDLFLGKLSETCAKIFIISGNHDSAERIAYGGEAFKRQGIYISPVFDGGVSKFEMEDDWGRVNVYLLPFIKPAHVKKYFEDVETYTQAVDAVIKAADVDKSERNIILAHQYVTGATLTGSEEVPIGGMDNVDCYVFDAFDYVALGHIHRSQKVGSEKMRYSGTPIKYSASEIGHEKCVLFGEIKEKGNLEMTVIPLVPMRDYKEKRGKLEDVLKSENTKDYVRVVLTDEGVVVDAYGRLKANYPYMTELVFERKRVAYETATGFSVEKSPLEQFCDFFLRINGRELTDEQEALVTKLLLGIKEGEE